MRPADDHSAADLSMILDEALGPGPWRNVIVAGTSVPRSLSDVGIPEGSFGFIPRVEWRLWNEIHSSRSERIVFGDYGVQSPKAPDKTKSGMMRANIRYTTADSILALRGVGAFNTLSPSQRVQQYQDLSRRLMENPIFTGRSCCAADLTLEQCADGHISPVSQTEWRRVGAMHHLTQVVGQLLAVEQKESVATKEAAPATRVRTRRETRHTVLAKSSPTGRRRPSS
jgi:hypothetical protein